MAPNWGGMAGGGGAPTSSVPTDSIPRLYSARVLGETTTSTTSPSLPSQAGVAPRTIAHLFETIQKIPAYRDRTLSATLCELHNTKLRDLLSEDVLVERGGGRASSTLHRRPPSPGGTMPRPPSPNLSRPFSPGPARRAPSAGRGASTARPRDIASDVVSRPSSPGRGPLGRPSSPGLVSRPSSPGLAARPNSPSRGPPLNAGTVVSNRDSVLSGASRRDSYRPQNANAPPFARAISSGGAAPGATVASADAANLAIRLSPRSGQVHIPGATERAVATHGELLHILELGASVRKTSSTLLNTDSSRSHLIFTIRIRDHGGGAGTTTSNGKITFCDLAGSERLKKSGASGDVMKEAVEINKSLTALGDVLQAIVTSQNYFGGGEGGNSSFGSSAAGPSPGDHSAAQGPTWAIPYRNHKLTQLMQDSLGGSAKTLMFVNLSPCSADESLMSLRFASRARQVRQKR